MTRAVIYARQSLDRTGEGAAVERQVADCRALASARGWDVTEILVDNDVSASTGKPRPGYQKLLRMMRTGSVDVAVVWHVDRLTRRLVDLEEVISLCEGAGVRLATVTGELDLATDTGRMLARILASVARGEVERKGTRQRSANRQRAEQGQARWTRRPFGYDRAGGRVIVVEAEATALRDAAASVLAGATLASVARDLDAQGLTTTAGKPWSVTSIRRVLLNPRYSGRQFYNGQEIGQGRWPAILDADVQDRLAGVLRDVKRRMQQGTDLKYLLSGICRCGRCGSTMFASPMGGNGKRWMVYRCTSCYLARRMEYVDELVEAVVLARLARPDAAALLAPEVDVDRLRGEAGDLRSRRDALAGMLADGLLSPAAVRKQAEALTARIGVLEGEIAAAVGESPVAALAGAEDVEAVWRSLPLRSRWSVVDLLLEVTILPAGKGVRFDPQHVRLEWRRTDA